MHHDRGAFVDSDTKKFRIVGHDFGHVLFRLARGEMRINRNVAQATESYQPGGVKKHPPAADAHTRGRLCHIDKKRSLNHGPGGRAADYAAAFGDCLYLALSS